MGRINCTRAGITKVKPHPLPRNHLAVSAAAAAAAAAAAEDEVEEASCGVGAVDVYVALAHRTVDLPTFRGEPKHRDTNKGVAASKHVAVDL